MLRAVREIALSLVLAFALFVAIDSLTLRSYVEGPSMEPNLYAEQALFISRLGISGFTRQAYAATHPDEALADHGWVPPRGSIVTFTHPSDPERTLVKRVIGLPGETVAMQEGVVYIDGQPLDEPYVVFRDRWTLPPQRIPFDSVFVMGDNRPNSSDSRVFGPVPRTSLLGVAVFRYWPPQDAAFLLGQNGPGGPP